MSRSGYGSYHLGLSELFQACSVLQPAGYNDEMGQFFKGLTQKSAASKRKRGNNLTEGKEPLPFMLFCKLCEWMMHDDGSDAIFGHLFLTITWNLICRSKNTVHIHRQHLSWTDVDCAAVQFAHMKNDMSGFESSRKRHLFANPDNPNICVILSLARYMVTFPSDGRSLLFGEGSYSRFSKYLGKILKKHEAEVIVLGVDPSDMGVHSIRKGAATYCCSGTTAAPHIASVCNRAGWTMGRVKDTYIKYEAASDHYVGHVVAGLNVHSEDFAVSPPMFKIRASSPNDTPTNNEEQDSTSCTEEDIVRDISILFPYVVTISFRYFARMCLATLLYHLSHLKNVTSKLSPFSQTILFQEGHFQRTLAAVYVCYSWQDDHSLEMTGIPPHIELYAKHCQLQNSQKEIIAYINRQEERDENLVKRLSEKINEELNKRRINGGELTMDLITEHVIRPINTRLTSLESSFNLGRIQPPLPPLEDQPQEPTGTGNEADPVFFARYFWDGKPRMLPQSYSINRKMSPLLAWQQWHHPTMFGEKSIPPLKKTSHKDYCSNQRRCFHHIRRMCNKFDSACSITGGT